jgi:hypothetical protein
LFDINGSRRRRRICITIISIRSRWIICRGWWGICPVFVTHMFFYNKKSNQIKSNQIKKIKNQLTFNKKNNIQKEKRKELLKVVLEVVKKGGNKRERIGAKRGKREQDK